MTLDDESSVYVGGLPYDATEETIRRNFSTYGSIVDVKIINDRLTRGKCYGFVTFTDPRAAVDAIDTMNGRTIGGRVVRVNKVTTRGGLANFHREHPQRDEWNRGRDRDREHDRERVRYRDRYTDGSRERDRSEDRDFRRERAHDSHGHERVRESFLNGDADRVVEENMRDKLENDREWEKDHQLSSDHDREDGGATEYQRSTDEDKDQQFTRWNGSVNEQHDRGISEDPDDDYNDIKKEIERSMQRWEELKKEIPELDASLQERQQAVRDLRKKSQMLEDALITEKKLFSQKKMQLAKMHKAFLQIKDYKERLKSCEEEFQSLVNSMALETEEDIGCRD